MADFALDIAVRGIVQGVGFRPFVYRMAAEFGVRGWVLNGVEGVRIHAEGDPAAVDAFAMAVHDRAPAAARVQEMTLDEAPVEGFADFRIRTSADEPAQATTLVSPDLSTCDACARELFDPADRRYRYPFINCTNCGPRFTIIRGLPYDRPATSMAEFAMCPTCAAEYADPADRRFHAQPDACWECGPHLRLSEGGGAWTWGRTRAASDAILARAVELLRGGGIVAVKGLGGFHLCCDADNPEALARLRERKRRPGKAFACMVRTVDAARERCAVSDDEAALLRSPARPIVLLRKRADAPVARGLADGLPELGLMLPATPLQMLLLADFGGMLVMTSGNVHGEPILTDDEAARTALAGIADAIVGHDRPILARYDDSVARVLDFGALGTSVQMIRRARGYAPLPIRLPEGCADGSVFATGPEQKATFCLTRPGEAFVSQHIGDLENAATFDAWLEAKATYERLLRIAPERVACDEHAGYLTSAWAAEAGLPVARVQHHHAHVVAAMAEHGLDGPVCGFAFDGTGAGEDGAIWGGEVLLANLRTFERFANLAYFPLPGGAAAIRRPRQGAYGALWACDLLEHPGARGLLEALGDAMPTLEAMIERGVNCPHTSSMGRLFDAVSALLGVCPEPTYEGEPSILLEAAIGDATSDAAPADERYRFAIVKNTATETSTARDTSVVLLDPAPVLQAVLDDVAAGVATAVVARRFHDAVCAAVLECAQLVLALYDIRTVVLAGGVFMNRYVMEHVVPQLADAGFTVATGRDLPPNDASISFGQSVIALQAEQHGEEE